jgi:hypothetical protein
MPVLPYFCFDESSLDFLLTFCLFATFKREKEGRRSCRVQEEKTGSIRGGKEVQKEGE